jgi:hypothetical protein
VAGTRRALDAARAGPAGSPVLRQSPSFSRNDEVRAGLPVLRGSVPFRCNPWLRSRRGAGPLSQTSGGEDGRCWCGKPRRRYEAPPEHRASSSQPPSRCIRGRWPTEAYRTARRDEAGPDSADASTAKPTPATMTTSSDDDYEHARRDATDVPRCNCTQGEAD